MTAKRASGILLHPTSLPSPFGIGDLGEEARAFIDFLHQAGQTLWQVLPLTPTGYGDSPYQSISAFAGNTLLIDPRALVADGLLLSDEVSEAFIDSDRVDFEAARSVKGELLNQAFARFRDQESASIASEFAAFCLQSAWWLDNYALFSAVKTANGNREWTAWDAQLAFRDSHAVSQALTDLADEITRQKFFQFLFFRQWQALRDYARERGVSIIGDLPLFVAHDSADVWALRHLFKLNDEGRPTVVAGVPPDYFSETGQLWGNPLYDWENLRATNFEWWIDRVRWSLELFDIVRIDHFRGFVACWEIPAGDATAQNGRWVETPGRELFAALKSKLGDLPIIAENLGVITPEVENLRDEFVFPGMRVLQFAFGGDATNDHLPHNHTRDSVVYTGTHDNNTTIGWFASLGNEEREYALRYLDTDGREINWELIREAMASVATLAIVPMQDVLGLDHEARMNLPASEHGNWSWRMKLNAVQNETVQRLKDVGQTYGRNMDREARG
ncbi:MAG TPA: 4-alpha-glucanotransferase [Pyrinomonadaceae bacterium]|nr:4-alpha-glucanotransferase [Pyrinomonadaceae bacterium]